MDSKTKKKILNDTKKQLNIILSNSDVFKTAFSEKNFTNIISKNINMIAELEEKEKNKTSNEFMDKFNVILKNKISSITPTNFNEEYEFTDEIQYLKVYLKNSFDIDIDSYSIDKAKIDNLSKLDKTEHTTNYTDEQKSSSSSNFTQQPNGFNQSVYGNPEVYKETIINQMINKRIGDDYINGNYYFFLTKPKIIPILKYISGIFLILTGILFIAQIILTIITTNTGLCFYISDKDPAVPFGGSIYSYLLLALEAFVLIYSSLSYFKKTTNDNFKYKPNNFMYYLLFYLGIMFIYNSINYIGLFGEAEACAKNTLKAINLYKGLSYLSLTTNILLISFIIFPMLNYIYKPQENKELRSMLYQKYRKEIEELGLVK